MANEVRGMFRRRNYLTNPKFQITFLGYMFGIAMLNVALLFAANKYFFWAYNTEAINTGLATDHLFFTFLHRQQSFMMLVTLCVSIMSTLLVIVGGILISHKIAGPMHRLTMHMNRVAAGENGRRSGIPNQRLLSRSSG